MKNIQFSVVRSLFLTLFLGVFIPSQAQCVPGLGTASGFVIYTAGGAVANTAISTINGDIGTNLGAITGFGTAIVTGTFYNGTPLTQTAAHDLSTAYGAFQNLTPTVTNHAPVFGNGETITAGVYSIASAVAISGTLTLDGQNNPNAKFIFQIGGALNSSAVAKIVLTNGATPNNVYWVVLNACGLGANTTFFGTIMAGAAIAAGDNCQIQGKLLSVAGAIAINNSYLSNNGSSMFYADADHDGYGNPAVSSCFYVAGYVNNDKDCSDNNAAINPGAVEIWGNYIDENCDGIIFRPQEQCLPSVGMASEFTLFTGAGAITHSATVSNITGNIGTNLGVISGFEMSHVTGTFINANGITQTAKQDLISAYTMFQNLAPTVTDHAPAFGSETLTAGIYSIGGAGSIAGVLVLDGQNNCENKFVFKFGGAFTTGAGCSVILINGALPKNIYWIANGAAGLAANVSFNGTIINNAALSVGLGVTLNGKLLTTTGAITLLGSNLTNSGPIQNTFYSDNDTDGYGDSSISVLDSNCSLPGYTLDGNDCDDTNSSIHPYAIEIYGNAIDDNCNGIVDTDAISCSFTTTWNGTSWVPFLPVANQHAVIAGNYSLSGDLNSCTLDIVNNAVVSVPAGTNFTINGAITVAPTATLLFNNNTNLIQTDNTAVNIGNIVVKRNSASIVRLDHTLWSSPVVGQNLFSFSPATLTNRFYTYDSPTNTYVNATLNSTSEFTPAKGYGIRSPNNQSTTVPAEWTGTFTGVPNNGNISIPLSPYASNGNNYNLIGNPFPSEIDAMEFLNHNEGTIDGTIYFYQHTLPMNATGIFPQGTNYGTVNDTGGIPATQFNNIPNFPYVAAIPGGTIQVGQGFIVKAIASGNVTFTNSMRIAHNSNQFNKATVATVKNRLWLNLLSNTGADINQILVGYITGATQAVDSKFDGLSYGNKGSYLYSTIAGGNYAVQGRSLPFDASDEVSLGFKCIEAGTFSIKLSDRDGLFLNNQDVFIRDNLTGVDTNIKLAPYTFTSQIGVFDNRFKIVYTQALGIPSTDFTPNSVIVYKNNDWFHVSTKGITMKDILAYDISGRLIYKLSDINATTAVLRGLPQTNEILFFKILSEENATVTVKAIGY
jgi:hypothetical protein